MICSQTKTTIVDKVNKHDFSAEAGINLKTEIINDEPGYEEIVRQTTERAIADMSEEEREEMRKCAPSESEVCA